MGNDSKDSLPNKNRESVGKVALCTSFLGNILTDCFLSTEFGFCILVNDHFAGRREEVGQGKEVRASIPVRPRQKAWSRNFTFQVWTQGGEEEKWEAVFSRGRV